MHGNFAIQKLGRRLRIAMIGGAGHSLIGPVHRAAARFDDLFEISASVLSSDPERSRAAGDALGIPRSYASVEEMFAGEKLRADPIDAVAIATPNDSHYSLCVEALSQGFHVICDKPLTNTLSEAIALREVAEKSGRILVLTHNYSGYPMVRQAREMVRAGVLGKVQQIHGVYALGQMATLFEDKAETTPNSMIWRVDPERGGASHVLMDIGTHVQHLAHYVTGLEVTDVCTDLGAVVAGPRAHDSANIMFRLENGGFGTMWTTKAAAGASKLELEVYGEAGGLHWRQSDAGNLCYLRQNQPPQMLGRQISALSELARGAMRGPGYHFAEGYREAFANIYADFARLIVAKIKDTAVPECVLQVPGITDGIRTMRFVEACLRSSSERRWISLEEV